MKTIISTEQAPAAIGPYAQGVAAGKLIITSGQLPLDPATGAFPEGIAAQTKPVADQRQGDPRGSAASAWSTSSRRPCSSAT